MKSTIKRYKVKKNHPWKTGRLAKSSPVDSDYNQYCYEAAAKSIKYNKTHSFNHSLIV